METHSFRNIPVFDRSAASETRFLVSGAAVGILLWISVRLFSKYTVALYVLFCAALLWAATMAVLAWRRGYFAPRSFGAEVDIGDNGITVSRRRPKAGYTIAWKSVRSISIEQRVVQRGEIKGLGSARVTYLIVDCADRQPQTFYQSAVPALFWEQMILVAQHNGVPVHNLESIGTLDNSRSL